jgi:acyl-coenzyme A thioesterase PaaI-like protein
MGRVHGGFLAAIVDITTGQGVKRILDDGCSLVPATTNAEYLGPAMACESR